MRLPFKREIDRALPVSMYYQLMQVILDQIDAENWQPHQLLPTEKELCQTYKISRQTVRQALDGLEKDGVIYRIQGKGTYLAERRFENLLLDQLDGFADLMGAKNIPIKDVVIDKGIYPASPRIADVLNIPQGTDTIKIKRVRYVENKPYVIVSSYIRYDFCPWLLDEYDETKSIYNMFRQHGLIIDKAERTLEPALANKEHEDFLDMKIGSPIHKMQSISFLEDGSPIEYFRAEMRGDKGKYKVTLRRNDRKM